MYKFSKTFYTTKVDYATTNTIRGLGIRWTFRINRRRKRGKRGGRKMVRRRNTNQGKHRSLLIPLERHHKTLWNPFGHELMLTNIQSPMPKIHKIIHYFLQHKLDMFFITETWISKEEDLLYIKANLMKQSFNILSCERRNRKEGGFACIYKGQHKVKLSTQQNHGSFGSLTI